MKEKINVDPKQAQTQDAQLVAEEMAANNEKAVTVDVEADYEASKQFSVSEIDRTDEGAKAAEAAVSSDFAVPKAEDTEIKAQPTGNPSDYKDMAKEVNPSTKHQGATAEKSGESGDPANYLDMAKEINS